MKPIPVAAMLVLLAAPVGGQTPLSLERVRARFATTLDSLHRRHHFIGATAAFVLPDGRSGEDAVGWADLERRIPMRPGSRMLSGSAGKTFVGATALALAREGRLDLDRPIAAWFADEPWFERLPNARSITLRHLLGHASGLDDYAYDSVFHRALKERLATRGPDATFTPRELLGFVLDRPARFPPGEGFFYTDAGFLLAGLAIEKAAGVRYHDELRHRFLRPLGLDRTEPSTRRDPAGLAAGYTDLADNMLGLPPKTLVGGKLVWNPAFEWTGGGLVTNSRDLARWAKALFEGRAMTGAYLDRLLAPAGRDSAGRGYGLGVGLGHSPLGPEYGHGGWFPGGYRTRMSYFPAPRVAVAVQFNMEGPPVRDSLRPMFLALASAVVHSLSESNGGEVLGDPDREEAGRVEAALDPIVSRVMTADHVPGAVVAIVHRGRVVLSKGYGVSDLGTRRSVSPDSTVFRLASVSKLVTATAAMQLVERGRLDLEADVNRYLDRFRIGANFAEPVTLRHLLTHTAGFDDRYIGMYWRTRASAPELGSHLARRMPPRVRPPGWMVSYSNYGAALVGYLVERASGVPFAEYVDREIFRPLGMDRSRFSDGAEYGSWLATGYLHDDGYQVVPAPYELAPAGALVATATDMTAFMLAHLRGGAGILAESTTALMHRRQYAAHPGLDGWAFGFAETTIRGRRAIEHTGDSPGTASSLVLVPGLDLGVFTAYNNDENALRDSVTAAVVDLYGEPVTEPVAPRVQGPDLAPFAGVFRGTRYSQTSMLRILGLFPEIRVRPSGRGTLDLDYFVLPRRLELEPVGPDWFKAVGEELYAAFRRDSAGRVVAFALSREDSREYERVAPWRSGPRQSLVLGLSLVALGLGSALGAARGPTDRLRAFPVLLVAGQLGVLGSLLGVLGVIAVNLQAGGGEFFFGVPPAMGLGLVVLWASLAACVAGLIRGVKVWRPGARPRARLAYALALAGTAGAIAFAAEWRWLGWWT